MNAGFDLLDDDGWSLHRIEVQLEIGLERRYSALSERVVARL